MIISTMKNCLDMNSYSVCLCVYVCIIMCVSIGGLGGFQTAEFDLYCLLTIASIAATIAHIG